MKGWISSGVAALLLASAPAAMAVPANTLAAAVDSMVFNFTAPMITNSGVLGSTHFIRVAVIGMSLDDLMISIPEQMQRFDKVVITNGSGQTIAAKTVFDKKRLAVTFDRPVPAGSYVNVEFTGVSMSPITDGAILLYQVTGKRTGIRSEIPIGTARVQLPSRS